MGTRISVVVGTDLPQISRLVSNCFKVTADLSVVGIASDETGVLHLAKLHRPNIAIVSFTVQPIILGALVSSLAANRVCPLIMSDAVEDTDALELLQCGLGGILPPSATEQMLCQSVRAVAAGEIWIQRRMIGKLIHEVRESSAVPSDLPRHTDRRRHKSHQENLFSLTHRELQIVQATSEGRTNKEIALALSISEFTVKHHLAKIFDKLGVYSRLELATFAVHHHLCKKSVLIEQGASLQPVGPIGSRKSTF